MGGMNAGRQLLMMIAPAGESGAACGGINTQSHELFTSRRRAGGLIFKCLGLKRGLSFTATFK